MSFIKVHSPATKVVGQIRLREADPSEVAREGSAHDHLDLAGFSAFNSSIVCFSALWPHLGRCQRFWAPKSLSRHVTDSTFSSVTRSATYPRKGVRADATKLVFSSWAARKDAKTSLLHFCESPRIRVNSWRAVELRLAAQANGWDFGLGKSLQIRTSDGSQIRKIRKIRVRVLLRANLKMQFRTLRNWCSQTAVEGLLVSWRAEEMHADMK
jgi:hypothetical protein